MRPYQLSVMPVYHLDKNSAPAHFIHVTDVISIDYARKCELDDLIEIMDMMGASSAVRTAESQFAIWVPRPNVDSYSLIDERISSPQGSPTVFLRNNGCSYSAEPAECGMIKQMASNVA